MQQSFKIPKFSYLSKNRKKPFSEVLAAISKCMHVHEGELNFRPVEKPEVAENAILITPKPLVYVNWQWQYNMLVGFPKLSGIDVMQ